MHRIGCMILRICVRVAQQTLTLYVWVRILDPQPRHNGHLRVSVFLCLGCGSIASYPAPNARVRNWVRFPRRQKKDQVEFDLVFFQRCLPLRASDVDFVSDVHCVSDVSPYGEVGKHHITLRRRSNTSLWRSHNITAATPQHHSQSSPSNSRFEVDFRAEICYHKSRKAVKL